MALTPIPALPDPPIRGTDTGQVFSDKTAALLDALQPWTDAVNEFGDDVVDAAADANYSSVSTTSVTIGTGPKSFTVEAGKRYVLGTPIKVTSASDSARWMFGTVATYDVVTGALTATMTRVGSGTGTHADWSISLSGIQGETGNPADAGVDVQEFTSSGTWTKPANAQMVMIEVIGAGGGGGGGNGDNAGVITTGGGGGGGGGYSRRIWLAGDLSATETVTVGAGGSGGNGGRTSSTAPTSGSAGGNTSVGTAGSLRAWAGGGAGGPTLINSGGKGGGSLYDLSSTGRPTYTGGSEFDGQFGAGFFTVTTTDRHGPSSVMGGGTGGGSYASGTTLATNAAGGSSVHGGAGGGGGASVDTAGNRSNGFAGGGDGTGTSGAAGGTSVASGAGGNGTAASVNRTGGGGGGATLDNIAAAGIGGAGLRGGGGGGGGGRTSAGGGRNGGAGGAGGNGYVRITTWFDA